MALSLRPFRASDLESLSEVIADACAWIDLPAILAEKLEPGIAGAPTVSVVDDSDGALRGLSVLCGDRLRLLAVTPAMRGKGVGSLLLNAAELEAGRGCSRLRIADEAGNYVAPGIDDRDIETLGWFERRGYRRVGVNQSLVVRLDDNPKVSETERSRAVAAVGDRYTIRRMAPERLPSIAAEVERSYGRAWAFELERAGSAPSGVWIAEQGTALAAFAAFDGNNRGLGAFGPAATLPEHRGAGLGRALLLCCLCNAVERGYSECTISWIGPRDFYDRVAGIDATRTFVVLEKTLNQSE